MDSKCVGEFERSLKLVARCSTLVARRSSLLAGCCSCVCVSVCVFWIRYVPIEEAWKKPNIFQDPNIYSFSKPNNKYIFAKYLTKYLVCKNNRYALFMQFVIMQINNLIKIRCDLHQNLNFPKVRTNSSFIQEKVTLPSLRSSSRQNSGHTIAIAWRHQFASRQHNKLNGPSP